MRGRTTTLAVLEALETLQEPTHTHAIERSKQSVSRPVRQLRVTGRALAARLQLHPATVYANLKLLRSWASLCSADHGTPHSCRVWMVASHTSLSQIGQ